MDAPNCRAVLAISTYMHTDPVLKTVRDALNIFARAPRDSSSRCYLLQSARVATFHAYGLAGDVEIAGLPGLGLYATSRVEVSCFCCGLSCRLGHLLRPSPDGRNNPSCPLQAARIRPTDPAMFADFLDRDVAQKLAPVASLCDIKARFLTVRDLVLAAGLKLDSALFWLAEQRLCENNDLAGVTSEQLVQDLMLDATRLYKRYPSLDAESTFSQAFCWLVPDSPEGLTEQEMPVELPGMRGRVTSDPVCWL